MKHESTITLTQLTQAEGGIGAVFTPEVTHVAEAVVRGEYHRQTSGDIICKCIDGRNCNNGLDGPNSAGGTISLLVADDLTSQCFISSQEPISQGMTRLIAVLRDQGLPVGIHSDTHASGENSGCGANDKLPLIYAMIVKKAKHIQELAGAILGMAVTDDLHASIVNQAVARTVFSAGAEVAEATVAIAGPDALEILEGGHQEVVVVVNKIASTTLDRDALKQATSGKYQAFNVDAWAFTASARAIVEATNQDVTPQVVALTYYNIATALVLCGTDMRVGILE